MAESSYQPLAKAGGRDKPTVLRTLPSGSDDCEEAHNHYGREIFRGDISKAKDLLFTAKITSRSKEKELDVFLASNTAEEVCDFKVKASSRGGSCVIYAGGSSIHNCCRGYGKYMVTVHPNMDYAFIAALILMIDSMPNRV
ncbi:hypothetical protein L1049_007561 [Liquidambar formosana]|uniref:Uncharacterized protein n=1 Tax=Liquidambar formosana TaxID=63359 RepID=A0AAP0X414_LIQFO